MGRASESLILVFSGLTRGSEAIFRNLVRILRFDGWGSGQIEEARPYCGGVGIPRQADGLSWGTLTGKSGKALGVLK